MGFISVRQGWPHAHSGLPVPSPPPLASYEALEGARVPAGVARASFPRFPSAREAPAAHRTPRRALPNDTPDLIKTRARLPSSQGRRPVEQPSTFVLQGGPLLNSGVSGSSR